MLRSYKPIVGLAAIVAGGTACFIACGGGSSADVACDPTDPTCVAPDAGDDGAGGDALSDGLGDGFDFPDGSVVLPDGAVLLPDGAVVPGPGKDSGVTPPPDGAGTDGGGGPVPGCTADNAACSGATCCSGTCTAGKCAPLSATCKTVGNPCAAGAECCSSFCTGGFCANPSFCVLTGDACTAKSYCCSGTCNIAAGATVGTCGAIPVGSSRCSGGVDGTVCGTCTDCCSRICAPYAPTGVKVCQPAEGCHINGDLCRKTSDCCGAAGTGLPGDGHVTCEIAAGADVGICRNPMACNPEGDVCHYKSALVCGISSAPADCCGALGSKGGACVPDALGVPRCYAGGACKKGGETCAYSADCCDGVPCVPDASGVLRCLSVPPGSPPCVASTGGCTTDADCCSGLTCSHLAGSVSGTCGGVTPPPPPPPPPDGGTTTDTGAPPSDTGGVPPGDGGVLPCSLYGQICTSDGSCCSGVPCLDALGGACSGGPGCTCHYVIR